MEANIYAFIHFMTDQLFFKANKNIILFYMPIRYYESEV